MSSQAQLHLRFVSDPAPMPNSEGFQRRAVIPSLNPNKADVPVLVQCYGDAAKALLLGFQQYPKGPEILALGTVKNPKNEQGASKFVFVASSFPAFSNQVTLIGRIGGDPEVKRFESGSMVAKGSIAVSQAKNAPPHWFNYEAWGRDAETLEKYCRKGTQLALSGEVAVETWTDKQTGDMRVKVVLKVSRLTFCGSKKDEESQGYPSEIPANAPTTSTLKHPPAQSAPAKDYDDIPF